MTRTGMFGGLVAVALVVTTTTPVRTREADPGAPPSLSPATLSGDARERALESMAAVPLHFERNLGQVDSAFDFTAAGAGYRVGLGGGSATIVLTDRDRSSNVFRFVLDGARAGSLGQPLDTLPGTASYYRGNDPSRWQSGVTTHARVRYADVFDGIDVVYYGNQRRLQYDFVVSPGADPGRITFRVEGAERVSVGDDGALKMTVGDRILEQERPFTYQEIDGVRHEVPSHFVVDGNRVRFAVGAYDRRQAARD